MVSSIEEEEKALPFPRIQVRGRGGRISALQFLGSERLHFQYQYSKEPLAKLLEMSSGLVSVPFWKVLLELKSVKLTKVSTLFQQRIKESQ
jgi:hypothetical protein